jgi:hypothetical protein
MKRNIIITGICLAIMFLGFFLAGRIICGLVRGQDLINKQNEKKSLDN